MTSVPPPVRCPSCHNKHYQCIECRRRIPFRDYNARFEQEVAVYCDCCNHDFVCKSCYAKHPTYDHWRDKFGSQHSIKDRISGISAASRLLETLQKGDLKNLTMRPMGNNIFMISTNGM